MREDDDRLLIAKRPSRVSQLVQIRFESDGESYCKDIAEDSEDARQLLKLKIVGFFSNSSILTHQKPPIRMNFVRVQLSESCQA